MTNSNGRGVWHAALMRWLTSAIYASVKTMGARQTKVMSRAMSLVFVRGLVNEARSRNHGEPAPTDNATEALHRFRALEDQQRLDEAQNVSIESQEDGEIRLSFTGCPYGPLCNETLAGLLSRGDFNKSSVPCVRTDTYSAALAVLSNVKRPYRLIQFAPGARCQSALLPARGARQGE